MNVLAYLQPVRTFLPATGVGRHINGMLGELSRCENVDLEVGFAREWLGRDGRLPSNAPLRWLPHRVYPWPERLTERSWKILGGPRMRSFFSGADCIYSPSDVVLPRQNVPVFITLHDVYPLDPLYPGYEHNPGRNSQRRRWEYWVPKLFRSATAVLTVSEFSRARMHALVDCGDTPIHVVGNGVDPAFFELANRDPQQCRRPCSWPYVLVIGGLTDRKGAESTVRVARFLRMRGSSLRIVVAGKSESHWSRVAANEPQIIECGAIDDRLMGDYLRAARGLLFLSTYEGFGIPVVEAMAAGIPAVVANTSSLPEVAGQAGVVVPSDAPEEIADRLETLHQDTEARQHLVRLGLQHAGHYTWSACVDRLVRVFQEYSVGNLGKAGG